jgi:hypothetical protein
MVFTNVLVITTTKGMLHGILGHTTNLGAAIALDGVLVKGATGLEERLVGTTALGDNTNLRADGRRNSLFPTREQTKASCALFIIVRHNNRLTGQLAFIQSIPRFWRQGKQIRKAKKRR